MKQAKVQKNFNLSDQKTKNIIERRCADLGQINNQSASFILEEAIMKGLFPKNKEAYELTTCYLYNDEQNSIKNTLNAAFQNNAARTNWKSGHDNYLPILMFCLKYYKGPTKFSGREEEFYHLLDQLDLVIDRINKSVKGIIDIDERTFFTVKAQNAAKLNAELKESPKKINPHYIFEVLVDFFGMLDDWTFTYRALSDLAAICTFEESANARIELYDIIQELSVDWNQKNEKDCDHETSINTELYLPRVNLTISDEDQIEDSYIAVHANDARVGSLTAAINNLIWNTAGNYNPKYQFKNVDIFAAVVAALKKYKNEHGYKYLVIDSFVSGYANILDHSMLRRVGFKQLPDNNPALYFLD